MAENARLAEWLRDRAERSKPPVVKAVYEGLRMRVERGDFDADVPAARLSQAVILEAAAVPEALVMWAAKVSAKGVVWTDDLHALRQIIPVTPAHPGGDS